MLNQKVNKVNADKGIGGYSASHLGLYFILETPQLWEKEV